MGWVLCRDINSLRKSERDGSSAASALNLACHQSNTFNLTILLRPNLVGGLDKILSGSGREYWTDSDFSCVNYENLLLLGEVKIEVP